jgi:quinol monooxygenase YgiN
LKSEGVTAEDIWSVMYSIIGHIGMPRFVSMLPALRAELRPGSQRGEDMICVTAVIRIEPGRGDEAAQVFKQIVDAVAEEECTVAYLVGRGSDDDHLFTVFEQYPDADAQGAHRAGRACTEVQAPLRDLLDGKPEVITSSLLASAR